ncbi:FG-GAP repeat domain-containing protein [Saccharicrinis sp. FJH62]|uniref:FG-GAP repeat domain-containing protein n=1 Tax=Saccharicrinis sp. FJH62 TaxID=3344657 RepID=UPI0035D50C4B
MNKIKILLISTLVLIIFNSCQEHISVNQEEENLQSTTLLKSVIPGCPDGYYNAGIGYDPINKLELFPAIKCSSILRTYTINTVPNYFSSITESKDVKLSAGIDLKFNINGTIVSETSLDRTMEMNIDANYNYEEKKVTIISRIQINTERAYVANPELSEEALSYLNQDVSAFIDRYGYYYVDDVTTGAICYSIYVYDYSKSSIHTKLEIEEAAKLKIEKIFGVETNSTLSSEMESALSTCYVNGWTFTNISGYYQPLISSLSEYNASMDDLKDYLNEHPERAVPVEMTIVPYSDFIENSNLDVAENILEQYKNISKWRTLKDELTRIKELTTNTVLIVNATNAISEIDGIINSFNIGSSSYPPEEGLYDDIISVWISENFDLLEIARQSAISRYTTNSYGFYDDGGDICLEDINNNGVLDMVLLHLDDPTGGNYIIYSIGWDLRTDGTPSRWSYGSTPISSSYYNEGAGVSIADINNDGHKDMVVMFIDNPSTDNYAIFKVGYNISESGSVSYWGNNYKAPMSLGYHTDFAGMTLADIDKNGVLDYVITNNDNPNGPNSQYYRIGWNINSYGIPQVWGPSIKIKGVHADRNSAAGVAIGDITGNGRNDIILFCINDYYEDEGFIVVGKDISSTGAVAEENWTSVEKYNANYAVHIQGGGIDIGDINLDGKNDLVMYFVNDNTGNNAGIYQAKIR